MTDLVERQQAGDLERPSVGLHGRLQGNVYWMPDGLSFEQWLHDGEVLQEIEKRIGWWIGGWLRAGEQTFDSGEDKSKYTQALKASGYAYSTLRNAASVAGKFEPDRRRERLSFTHHQEVANLPVADQEELLTIAEGDGEHIMSTLDLRELTKKRAAQLKHNQNAAKPVPALQPANLWTFVGDATAMPLRSSSVNLIITSPPYALEKDYEFGDVLGAAWWHFMVDFCAEAYRVAAAGCRFALNVPLDTSLGGFRPTYAQAIAAAQKAGWSYRSTVVWDDDQLGQSTARGSQDSARSPHIYAPTEMIPLFSKGLWGVEEPPERPSDLSHAGWVGWTNGLWRISGESNPWEEHPAPFPLELPRRLIYLLSFPGDLVLDPFCGSGTVLVAARDANRSAIGIDRSPFCIASTRRRLVKGWSG